MAPSFTASSAAMLQTSPEALSERSDEAEREISMIPHESCIGRWAAPACALFMLVACSESNEPNPPEDPDGQGQRDAASQAGPAIGDACEVSDFDLGRVDPNTLPAGERYCLTGPLYPDGYVTTNCTADRHCPDSACDGENCRRECDDDADCEKPAVCKDAEGIKWCQCLSCAIEM